VALVSKKNHRLQICSALTVIVEHRNIKTYSALSIGTAFCCSLTVSGLSDKLALSIGMRPYFHAGHTDKYSYRTDSGCIRHWNIRRH